MLEGVSIVDNKFRLSGDECTTFYGRQDSSFGRFFDGADKNSIQDSSLTPDVPGT